MRGKKGIGSGFRPPRHRTRVTGGAEKRERGEIGAFPGNEGGVERGWLFFHQGDLEREAGRVGVAEEVVVVDPLEMLHAPGAGILQLLIGGGHLEGEAVAGAGVEIELGEGALGEELFAGFAGEGFGLAVVGDERAAVVVVEGQAGGDDHRDRVGGDLVEAVEDGAVGGGEGDGDDGAVGIGGGGGRAVGGGCEDGLARLFVRAGEGRRAEDDASVDAAVDGDAFGIGAQFKRLGGERRGEREREEGKQGFHRQRGMVREGNGRSAAGEGATGERLTRTTAGGASGESGQSEKQRGGGRFTS